MALNRTAGGNLGVGPDDATQVSSDAPANEPSALVVRETALTEPIVVSNTLWQSTDPLAYQGGLEPDVTHLREFEASGLGRRDDARWSGPLEIIPTKADYVLDLIRANSLWPLLSGLAWSMPSLIASSAPMCHGCQRSRSGMSLARSAGSARPFAGSSSV